MSSAESKLKRREAHSAYQKMRTEYRSRLADKPIIIRSEDFADEATKLLKGPNLKNGLKVYIPSWDTLPPPQEREKIEVMFDRGTGRYDVVASHEFEIPAGGTAFPETFPNEMTIQAIDLPQDALCKLKYRHHTYNGDEIDSPVMDLICDQLPPYSHEPPLALKFATDLLDDTSLPAGGKLAATVPGYADWKATDSIAIYLVDAANIPEDPTAADLVFYGPVPSPGTTDSKVDIDADKVRAFGDAECVLLYALVDKALNPSAVSVHKKVTLTFGPLPVNLQPPEVPQAVPGPLAMEHALAGVSVWIPRYDNPKPKDSLRLKWGGTTLGDYVVGENPPEKFEIPVLPIDTLIKEYGQGTVGVKKTNISYQVIRNGRPFGPEETDIDVNFEVAIPWLPWPPVDWPNPVHPTLLEGEVKNHDGTRTNQLTRDDKNEDATFTFTWYAEAVNGHVVDFFWNGIPMVEAQIVFDDTNPEHKPGAEQTVDVLWKYIKQGNNGDDLPVHYEVTGPGLINELKSLPTLVDVNAISVDMPAPSFPTIPNPTGYPGCSVLDPNGDLQVAIPDLTGLLNTGDSIDFVFTPMKGSNLADPDDPIVAAIFEKTYVIGTDVPLTGGIIRVTPYDKHILPLYTENTDRRGRAKIQYFFNDGSEDIPSVPMTTRTAFHRPNDSCEIPRP